MIEFDNDIQMEDTGDNSSFNPESDVLPNNFAVPSMSRNVPGELTSQSLSELDSWIESLSRCSPLSEENVEMLCNMVGNGFRG